MFIVGLCEGSAADEKAPRTYERYDRCLNPAHVVLCRMVGELATMHARSHHCHESPGRE